MTNVRRVPENTSFSVVTSVHSSTCVAMRITRLKVLHTIMIIIIFISPMFNIFIHHCWQKPPKTNKQENKQRDTNSRTNLNNLYIFVASSRPKITQKMAYENVENQYHRRTVRPKIDPLAYVSPIQKA